MDITVLGKLTTWNQEQHQHVTVLSFVHTILAISKDHLDTPGPNSDFAWVCLVQEMAKEQKIGKGIQL